MKICARRLKRSIYCKCLLLLICSFDIQADTLYQQGRDYRLLQIPVKVQPDTATPNSKKQSQTQLLHRSIEVRLLVSHGCSECYDFIARWEAWPYRLAEDIDLQLSYINLDEATELLTEAYLVAEEFGLVKEVEELLHAVAYGLEPVIESKWQLTDFFNKQGVDARSYEVARQSMNVVNKMRQTKALSNIFRSRDVPAIIINGKYLTDVISARSYDNLLSIVEYLIEKERLTQLP